MYNSSEHCRWRPCRDAIDDLLYLFFLVGVIGFERCQHKRSAIGELRKLRQVVPQPSPLDPVRRAFALPCAGVSLAQ